MGLMFIRKGPKWGFGRKVTVNTFPQMRCDYEEIYLETILNNCPSVRCALQAQGTAKDSSFKKLDVSIKHLLTLLGAFELC
jgi:hypothetical protein